MNAKQSLKLCSHQLEIAEITLRRAQRDIKRYNDCIDSMIQGGSPCDFCEEKPECQLEAKAAGKGCGEWWLSYEPEPGSGEADAVGR